MSFVAGITIPPEFCRLLSLTLTGKGWENLGQVLEAVSLEKVRKQGLAPWVYYWLKLRGCEGHLPADLLRLLRQDYSQQLLCCTVEQNEIQEILTALTRAGLDVILLKGADLRQRVYGDPVLRIMSDLDLLLAPESIPLAEQVLIDLGYCLYPEHRDKRLRINEVLYNPPAGKILPVDLHWELVALCSFYCLPYRPLREEAVFLDFYGLRVLTLSPENLLIHVCLHAHENFPTLFQLLDIALIVSRLPINWPQVIENASRFACQLPVGQVLQEISRIVPAEIPIDALRKLGASSPSWLERVALRPELRFLTLALPFFYRHRSLRNWLRFIGAHLWPQRETLDAAGYRWTRQVHLKNLLRKFLFKVKADDEI